MERFSAWKPARVTNWNRYPMSASSRWNCAIVSRSSFFLQLNEDEQLYASSFPGNRAWTASAKVLASSRSGPDVSHHKRSAYGAYARPRAIDASMPPRNRWKPSVVRSVSMMKGWSRRSTSVVMSFAEFASVRAIRMVGTSHRSEARRAATSFWRKTPVETSTLPPRWPHFLALASWSSKCTALAPASISADPREGPLDPDRSAEPHHVLGSVRPNDAGPPLVLPPARVQFLCGPHRSSTPPIPTMTRKRPRTPSARALDLAAVPRSM